MERARGRSTVLFAVTVIAVLAAGAAVFFVARGGGHANIARDELATLPPLVLVAADGRKVGSGAGDLYTARADHDVARRIRAWPSLNTSRDSSTYGVRVARWSPDPGQ